MGTTNTSAGTTALAVTGATLALLAHGAKASTRLVVNTSPEPVSNVIVSLVEDGIVAALMTLALTAPAVALAITLVLAALSAIIVFAVARRARQMLTRRRHKRRP